MHFFLKILVFLLSANVTLLYAQEITGKVSNASGRALPFSTVILMSLPDSAFLAHTTTNSNGYFTLRHDRVGNTVLQVRHLGYVTQGQQLHLGGTNQTVNFTLEVSATELGSVTINARMLGARISGDTIIFNLGAYTDGTERVLGDILRNLPGIEVGESGRVYSEGQPIRVLIDGREFFLDQSQMATRNLPAGMVDGVQLIHNHQEIGMLRGSGQAQGITVLNISIGENYRNRISGVLGAGGGVMSRYSCKANLFNFSNSLSLATLLSGNNTGEMAFTLNDFIQFQIGHRLLQSSRGGSRFSLDAMNIPTQSFREDVERRVGQTAAFNLSYQHPNNKLQINSYLIANRQEQHGQMLSERWTLNNIGETPFSVDAHSEQNRFNFVNSYIGIDYQPSDRFFISNRSMINWQNIDFNNRVSRQFLTLSDSLTVGESVAVFDFRNDFLAMYQTQNYNFFTFDGFFRYNRRPNTLNLLSNRMFMDLPFTSISDEFVASQDNSQTIHEASFFVDYSHGLGSFFLVPQIGVSFLQQDLNTALFQRVEGINSLFLPEQDFANSLRYSNTNLWAGLWLERNLGIFRLSLGADIHYFSTNLNGKNQESLIENNQWKFLPSARITIQLAANHRLNLSFNLSEDARNAADLNESWSIRDFQSIVQGKVVDHLRNPSFRLSANYSHMNFHSGTTLILSSSYMRHSQPLTFKHSFHLGYSEVTVVESPSSSNFTAMLRFRQSLHVLPVDVRLSANYALRSSFTFIDHEKNAITQNTFRGDFGLMTFRRTAMLNGELGGRIMWLQNESKLMDRTMQLVTLSPYLILRANIGNGWTARASVEHSRYNANDMQRNVTNLSSSVVYIPPRSRFEFELRANNILNFNQTERITSVVSQSFFEERIIRTLPGYLLLKISFRL